MNPEQTGAPEAPSFRRALAYWLQLGCISFGGPAGQVALMHQELVERRRWISEGRFLHALNYCLLLPGPEAQQLATYLGWLLHGVRGGIAAGLLFVLPSLLLLIALSWAYLALGSTASAALLAGVKPAVIAIIAHAAWRVGSRSLRRPLARGLALFAFAVLSLLPVQAGTFPLLLALAALCGWLWRGAFAAPAPTPADAGARRPALIDDHSPTPAHAEIRPRRLLSTALLGLGLGLAVWGLLRGLGGADGRLADMAAFFTQAALLTFGGAYAVLPYVFHNAVQTYGWISAPQMLDGLALGESTPGPLIMVVAFIGYLGAAGVEQHWAAGIAGALVASFFTFLPSFLFILLGAPWVERSRGFSALTAPLSAIGAVVLAAIAHLAVVLAVQQFWPASGFDARSALLASLGLLALVRGWLGVVPLLALSAVLGWIWL